MIFGSPRRLLTAKARTRRPIGTYSYGLVQMEYLEERVMLAGAAYQLAFLTPPSQIAAGSPTAFSQLGPIQVAIEDISGAIVTTDTSRVTLLIPFGTGQAPQNGSINGTVSVTAVNGVATFSAATFNLPGTYSLTASSSSNLPIFSNPPPFTVTSPVSTLNFTTQPVDITAGAGQTIAVAIVDTTNNLVQTDRSTVTLSIFSGPTGGSITGGTTTGVISNGVVNFSNITFSKPGTYKLQAKDSNLSTASTSSSFTVTPGARAKLGFAVGPVSTPGNTAMGPVTVDVLDSVGNIVATDTSAITLNTALGQNSGFSPVTVNAVGGVATFNGLSFSQLGVFTLVATDDALAAATSNPFAITGPAAKLAFTRQPSQTTFGTVMPSFTVAIEDAGGNTVTNDNSSVTLATGSGPGNISGTTTVQAVNGVATFSNIVVSAEGIYSFNATDASLNPATSNNVIINGTASQLVFGVQPVSGAANTSLTPAITVLVEDQSGNIVLNNTTSVTITAGSLTTGGGSILGTTTVAAVNGVATFSNLVPNLAGTYTLFATDGSLAATTSNSFTVVPSASQLVFATDTSDLASGGIMFPSVVVHILNDFGQNVTTNTSSVTLAIVNGPSGGTMGGTTTVAAIAGVATFSNLTFTTQGTYTLVAYDGALASATASDFVVTGPAAKLQWGTQPAKTVIAGQTMPAFTAWVEDRNGHLIETDHTVVTVSILGGPAGGAIVSGAAVNADHGIAVFDNVQMNIAGSYTLSVADGALTTAKSKQFTILPDVSTSHVVITQTPTPVLVGKTLPTNVIAKVEDQFGNVINSGSPITLAIAGGPLGGVLNGNKVVSAKNGVATFGGISFSLAGGYTLSASGVNMNNTASAMASMTVGQVITTMPKPSVSSSYALGQAFTLHTQMKGLVASSVAWTGTVQIVDANNNVLATGTVGSGGALTLPVPGTLGAGVYVAHVKYSGDANHVGGNSPTFTLNIGPATTVQVVAADKTLTFGDDLSLTVTVKTGSSTAPERTGTLTLMEGTVTMGTPLVLGLGANSTGTMTLTAPATGSHLYTVVYSGDPNFRPSTSPVLTVTVAPVV